MSLKKNTFGTGSRRIIGSVTTGFGGSFDTLVRDEHEHIIGRTSEQFQHDPRRTWQLGFYQYRRPRSPDRQKSSSGVCSPTSPCLFHLWRLSEHTINNADRRHRMPALFGRRQTEAN